MLLQAHVVVLQLPAVLCAARAAQRVDHEGGLEGIAAKMVVHRMASQINKAGLPNAAEGLASVMVCAYRFSSRYASSYSSLSLECL